MDGWRVSGEAREMHTGARAGADDDGVEFGGHVCLWVPMQVWLNVSRRYSLSNLGKRSTKSRADLYMQTVSRDLGIEGQRRADSSYKSTMTCCYASPNVHSNQRTSITTSPSRLIARELHADGGSSHFNNYRSDSIWYLKLVEVSKAALEAVSLSAVNRG